MANLPTSIKNLNTLLGEQLTEGGGGGGGSSDFSTATVTVVGQYSEIDTLSIPSIIEAGTAGVPISFISPFSPEGAIVFTVPLYKGHAMLSAPDREVSGNIVKHNEGDWIWYDITGDCTITIS